jgi:flagellar biosynthesis/type III secretory pathway chaperone
MAGMNGGNLRTKLSKGRSRLKQAGGARVDMVKLAARVTELEAEVQECRQLNLRLAELTDIVQELLLPVSQRDQAKVEELLARYAGDLC